MVADELSGEVMVRSVAPPPEFKAMADAPVPVIVAAAPNVRDGVLTVNGRPAEMVSVTPAPSVMAPA